MTTETLKKLRAAQQAAEARGKVYYRAWKAAYVKAHVTMSPLDAVAAANAKMEGN